MNLLPLYFMIACACLVYLKFEENERKRMKAEIVRQELKHKKQWDELKSVNVANEKELEQIQVTIEHFYVTSKLN